MRIIFVGSHASTHTRRWASFYASRDHEVHVVTCGGALEGSADRYVVHDLGDLRFGKLGYLLKTPRARRLIRSLMPDIVHAHHATSYGLIGAVAGAHPLVVTSHGSDILISGRNIFMRLLLRRVLNAADLITAPAEHVRQAIYALGTQTNVAVFQYGVDARRLRRLASASRSMHPRKQPPVRVVSARPLSVLYNTDVIIRAVHILHRLGVDCILDIAGLGPQRGALTKLAESLGVADRIVFHGHLPDWHVEELIATADVYVSVAESDGASIALLEAMAAGAVPVLSDIPANRVWVKHSLNGVIVNIEPSSVAHGILHALELDRASVACRNLEIVIARGDRETNLSACEGMLMELAASRSGCKVHR